ncbi:MAG: XdhC/CoxI family protein [Anaerovoracaceae bacterium]|nr:XdhC/CoxI family protein [Anaerovoracaceae bacterium]
MADRVIYVARELLERGEDFVMAKVVDTHGSTPRKKGAYLLMKANGDRIGTVGGGKLEAETERICRETFKTKKSQIYHFRLTKEEQGGIDMRCGGDADIAIDYIDASNPANFTEDFGQRTTAYIFGAGHVAQALEPILRYIGFETVVMDDRAQFANRERYPEAKEVIVGDFEDAFKGIETDQDSYIIIVTRGHAADLTVLRQAVTKENAYIGMIGSRGKVKINLDQLASEGVSKKTLDKIYSPIGLEIYSETPEEIAISIAAEMIQVRAGHGTR